MKRIILYTLVFLSWTGVGISQIIDFPENEAVWKEEHTTIAGPFSRFFALCGDTTINSTTYIQVVELQVDMNLQITDKTYLGGLRQDGDETYFHDGSASELLLYDFSLNVGDEIMLRMPFSMSPINRKVDSVKTEMIADKMRKMIYFEPEDSYCPIEFWVEGIGSSFGLLGRGFSPCYATDFGSLLLCYGHKDEYYTLIDIECFLPDVTECGVINSVEEIEKKLIDLSIYPNPVENSFYINIEDRELLGLWSANIYKTDGTMIHSFENEFIKNKKVDISDLLSGIYFLEIISENKATRLFEKIVKL